MKDSGLEQINKEIEEELIEYMEREAWIGYTKLDSKIKV